MEAVTSAIRALLARAEAGEVAGVAFTANLAAGGVVTSFVGNFGARIVQLVDVASGERETLAPPPPPPARRTEVRGVRFPGVQVCGR